MKEVQKPLLHSYNRKNYLNNSITDSERPSYYDFEISLKNKEKARRKFYNYRKSLDSSKVRSLSILVCENLTKQEFFKQAGHIALYHPVHNEVDTTPLFKTACIEDKKIYYPRIHGDILSFHQVKDISDLIPATFGIPEPASTKPSVSLNLIDLFIIPGICFDIHGNRIGFGKGFYDRTLISADREKRIGLAYNFQVVKSIKTDKYDLPLGCIVNENGVIFC